MIANIAKDMIASVRQQLAYYANTIPLTAENTITRNKSILQNYMNMIPLRAHTRIESAGKDLDVWRERITIAVEQHLQHEKMRLQTLEKQVELLSPDRVLKRGYSLTVANGRIVTDASTLAKGDVMETRFASGKVISEVK